MANPYIKQSILPGEWDTQIKNVERDRVLAQQLAKDAGRFQKGDMVGQVYVPPSWTQYLAQILQGRQAGVEKDRADKRENDILTNKRDTYSNATKALADALNPKQVQVGETSAMPAYESNQMDRFGSPLPDAQRQPVVTPQYEMKRPAPQDIFKAQMEYGQAIGDPNAISQSVGNMASYGMKLEDRDYAKSEKLDDRAYNDTREEKIYTRNLADKRADTESDREFQRIMMKEQQGFQLTQQEKQFAQQWKMQQSSQGFQAGQNQLSRQSAIDAANIKATTTANKRTPLSAAAQKELFDAEDSVQGSKEAIKAFNKALSINKNAMGGWGAGAIATAGSVLPNAVRPNSIDATKELDNVLQGSALPQLKAIFGGMPTEGERAILLEVQGSSSQPASVREGIFKRAIDAANNRIKYNEQKAQQLRNGTYFTEEGGIKEPVKTPKVVDW